MSNRKADSLKRQLRAFAVIAFFIFVATNTRAQVKSTESPYARRNTFGIFGAYSNDSSHMILGYAGNRKLLNIGVSYSRRLLINRNVNLQYNAELLPVALESDPLSLFVNHQTTPTDVTSTFAGGPPVNCTPVNTSYSFTDSRGVTHTGTTSTYCHGRQWTMGEAVSPVGIQLNFRTGRTLQPFFTGHGGYMYSTHAIPLSYAGAFNFTFDGGVGVEFFRTKTRSIRVEYRYHHISNDFTAQTNPGIDSGLLQVTYAFGR